MRFPMPGHGAVLSTSLMAVAASVAAVPAAQAQTAGDGGPTVSISADLRVLAEAVEGQFRSSAPESEFFLSSRLQIEAEVDFGPVAFGGELRDSRALSIEDGSAARGSSINTLEPLQAWAALDFSPLGGEARLKGGRFTQKIGSGRLVGTPGYANNIVSYAGAQLNWQRGDTEVTGFWAHPFDTLPSSRAEVHDNKVELDRVSEGETFFGVHVAQSDLFAGATGEVFVYRLAEHDTDKVESKDRHLTTIGGRLVRKPAPGRFDFEIEAAGQFGTVRGSAAPTDFADIDAGAAFAHVSAGWTFDSPVKPNLSLELDYATGDGRDPDHYGRFDMLFGARRALGPTGIYGPLYWGNMISPGVRFSVQPSADLDIAGTVRGAWLDSATDSFSKTGVRDASGASGSYAGTQIEARARYWLIRKLLRLEVGGAVFANGRFMEEAPNASGNGDTTYGYAAVSASF
ncbi:alginate export family protein [Stakelama tenebrarum]|uniref:Alginate export family protein n=1 Tax=Stakelama tenebrarum TaxID=2711215 RepID=A0A6G6Y4A9_9SPHN|nr:alginate export family protein [Sphingosinithalassobacter tenebrarum]QIG79729.1 alginate export family protein [Sphingosinithalassobacter tenebrarum]